MAIVLLALFTASGAHSDVGIRHCHHRGIGTEDLWASALVLGFTVVLLFVFLFTGKLLSRKEGWILVAAYRAFTGWTLLGGGL